MHASPYLTSNEAARYLRLAEPTLRNQRSRGAGPAYVKLGAAVRYRIDDLDAYAQRVGTP